MRADTTVFISRVSSSEITFFGRPLFAHLALPAPGDVVGDVLLTIALGMQGVITCSTKTIVASVANNITDVLAAVDTHDNEFSTFTWEQCREKNVRKGSKNLGLRPSHKLCLRVAPIGVTRDRIDILNVSFLGTLYCDTTGQVNSAAFLNQN